MAIYEYKCEKCDSSFEKLVVNSAEEVVCETCKTAKYVKKQLSVFSASVAKSSKKSCSVSECNSCCPSGMCGM